MREKWTWMHYKLEGPPIISPDDWTIKAYGRENEINELVQRIKYFSERKTRQLLRLKEYWGTGKSTFLYNVCYRINNSLFFGDEIEEPEKEKYSHVLAFYLKEPQKRRELLEYVIQNGLPIPWSPELSKEEAIRKRIESWHKCVRKLAFILLRKALSEISRQHLEEEVISGSAFLKEIYGKLLTFKNLRTEEFIKKIDELSESDSRVFDEVSEVLRYYLRMLIPPIEEREGRVKVVRQEDFEIEFPRLLYPCTSGVFLASYRKLFGSSGINLRRFTAFEKLLRIADTFAFIVMDEIEDWSKVVKEKIDYDLHDLAVDAESPTSLVLAIRTETLNYLRSYSAMGRYLTIIDRFTDINLKNLSQKEIEELTAGILSTARNGKMTIFPCTPDFIAELAERSKRYEKFNIRQYIKLLIRILEWSLGWERENVQLTKDLFELAEVKEIIAGVSGEEKARAEMFKPPELEE